METILENPQRPKVNKKKKKNQQKTYKPIDPSFSEFKKAEKKYRLYKDYLTDFSELLVFSNDFDISSFPIQKTTISGFTVFKFLEPQGAYLVKDFLTIPEQIHITKKCLNEYNKKPYRTNLFIYETTENKEESLENKIQESIHVEDKCESHKNSKEENKEKELLTGANNSGQNEAINEEAKCKTNEANNCRKKEPTNEENKCECHDNPYNKKQESLENQKSQTEDTLSSLDPMYNKERFFICDPSRYCFDKKIRWSNVGYQYDWNNRTYPSEKTALPVDLENLSQKTKLFLKEELPEVLDYKAESTIINYYDAKNFMGGHLDDGEKDQKSPILSYNFGLSCVFLMGGRTKDVKPWAIKLDSGDLFIMSGFSRTCYHGVPRVLEGSFEHQKFEEFLKINHSKNFDEMTNNKENTNEKKEFTNNETHALNYLKENRLNLNFRQVFS